MRAMRPGRWAAGLSMWVPRRWDALPMVCPSPRCPLDNPSTCLCHSSLLTCLGASSCPLVCVLSPVCVSSSVLCVCSRHVGYFRLVTGEGVRFGHRIWADLFVENTNVPAVLRTLASPVIPAPAPAPLPPVPTAPPAVVSPAPPALPAVPPTHGKWHAQLMSLADMGFTDVDAAVAALESTQGNLARAIELLVSSA